MFKRRERRTIRQTLVEAVWPRGGWRRSFEYVKHRLRRLPDTPEKIARGVAAGVFASFTPFFGFHLILCWILARVIRGNVPAAIIGTFFGAPPTYPIIAWVSISTGHFLLGSKPTRGSHLSFAEKFGGATHDLWHNFQAIFTAEKTDWSQLTLFYNDVFFPFMIGCIIPGVICSAAIYAIVVPLVHAYQNSRRKRLSARLAQLQKPE